MRRVFFCVPLAQVPEGHVFVVFTNADAAVAGQFIGHRRHAVLLKISRAGAQPAMVLRQRPGDPQAVIEVTDVNHRVAVVAIRPRRFAQVQVQG
ncbi:hypothetical protein TOC8172_15270 [Pseudomonas syringae]